VCEGFQIMTSLRVVFLLLMLLRQGWGAKNDGFIDSCCGDGVMIANSGKDCRKINKPVSSNDFIFI